MYLLLNDLNQVLISNNYETDFDNEGIYIPLYDIDIIQDDERYIINPPNDDPVIANDIPQAMLIIKDYSNSQLMEAELDKNNYEYQHNEARYFSLKTEKIKIIDGHIYLEGNGEKNIYLNVGSVINALQSKFLGE